MVYKPTLTIDTDVYEEILLFVPQKFIDVILFMFTENVLIGDCLFSFFPEEYPRHYCESIKICGKYLERNAGYLLKRRCKYNMACRQFLWCQASHVQTVRWSLSFKNIFSWHKIFSVCAMWWHVPAVLCWHVSRPDLH